MRRMEFSDSTVFYLTTLSVIVTRLYKKLRKIHKVNSKRRKEQSETTWVFHYILIYAPNRKIIHYFYNLNVYGNC